MNKTVAKAAAVLLLGGALMAGSSAADAQIQYRPDSISVPASALLPRNSTITYDTNGVHLGTADGGIVEFHAPVELPNWAFITNVTLEAFDGSADIEFGGFVKATLNEVRFNTFLPLATATTDPATAPGDVRVSAPLEHVIDNDEFGYDLQVQFFNGAGGANSVRYYKVVIQYYWPEFF